MKKNKVRVDDVSIVIPVFNRFDILSDCLGSIDASTTRSYNIVIVDTGSDRADADAFYTKAKEKFQQRFAVLYRDGFGFPEACNTGAQRKQSKYIFFLNSDVILSPHSLDYMLEDLDADENVGIVGMKLLFPPDCAERGLRAGNDIRPANKVQHVGLVTNMSGNFYHMFVGWSEDNPKVMRVREVPAVTGAALLIRRSIFNRVNGFDVQYGRGTFEDVDLCLSVKYNLGYNIIVEQKAIGFHYTGATSETYSRPYPLGHNQLLFMSKWAGKIEYTEWKYL